MGEYMYEPMQPENTETEKASHGSNSVRRGAV